MAWKNLNLRTRGLGFDGVAMARPPNQNPKGRKAYLGVAKARPKAPLLSLRLFGKTASLQAQI